MDYKASEQYLVNLLHLYIIKYRYYVKVVLLLVEVICYGCSGSWQSYLLVITVCIECDDNTYLSRYITNTIKVNSSTCELEYTLLIYNNYFYIYYIIFKFTYFKHLSKHSNRLIMIYFRITVPLRHQLMKTYLKQLQCLCWI